MIDEREMRLRYNSLLDQIEYLFEQHQRYGQSSGGVRNAMQGLYSFAVEYNPDGMAEAFRKSRSEKLFKNLS